MESQVSGIFLLLYCTAFKLYTVGIQICCKNYVGEMRNIIILKSHLPTLLLVQPIPWQQYSLYGGHEVPKTTWGR